MLAKYKALLFICSTIFVMILITACSDNSTEKSEDKDNDSVKEEGSTESSELDFSNEDNPIVTITMENEDEILVELYPEVAPNTVNNFISLIEARFYNDLIFHRVIPGFMIQGGDPDGIGTGGPGYSIKGEFSSNEFDNKLVHDRGVLSMARSSSPDSAGSQFFIIVESSPHLDGDYASFGKVVEGMDIVDAIVSTERNKADKPIEDQRIKTVEVDTKGKDYPEPDKE